MPGLILLASFMKSGNTWLRILLQALDSADGAVDINALRATVSATSRASFEQMAGIESRHLSAIEIAAVRPDVARMLARQAGRPTRLKVHEAYLPAFGAPTPAFPPETVQAVLHLVRDPRDVAVSPPPDSPRTCSGTPPGGATSMPRPERAAPACCSPANAATSPSATGGGSRWPAICGPAAWACWPMNCGRYGTAAPRRQSQPAPGWTASMRSSSSAICGSRVRRS
ncbi:MAG: hypothetical protein AB7G39_10975 [Alphaproteobacteria bacterium]